MAPTLYRPRTADGRAQQGFVEAASDRMASDWVDIDGLAQIRSEQPPAMSPVPVRLAGFDAASQVQWAPLTRLNNRWREQPGLVPVLQTVARRAWPVLVPAGVLLGGGLWGGSPWLAALSAGLLVAPFAPAVWRHRHADRHQRLLEAHALGRWSEMVGLAGELRASGRIAAMVDFDLDVRLATLRSRQGDLDGALESLAPWRQQLAGQADAAEQAGLFEASLASVHAAAGDRTSFVRLMGQAQAVSGDAPARMLAHALAQARFGELDQAEALMARLSGTPWLPEQQCLALWAQGLIAMRRDRPDAIAVLSQALSECLAHAQQPALWPTLALCACDQVIALKAAGERARARSLLKRVMPVLRAHADAPLLALLKRERLISRR